VWIPGNFLAEGMITVSPSLSTYETQVTHLLERDAVAFQVLDPHKGDSVRGDYVGHFVGIVRPRFHWESTYQARYVPVGYNGNGTAEGHKSLAAQSVPSEPRRGTPQSRSSRVPPL
jgi:hypothetical protein